MKSLILFASFIICFIMFAFFLSEDIKNWYPISFTAILSTAFICMLANDCK